MKLSKIIVAVVTASTLAGTAVVTNSTVKAKEKTPETVQIVSENGYKVLKDKDTSKSTIACEMVKISKDGVTCKNVFDSEDVIELEKNEVKKSWKEGDILLVTFTGDWVTSTKKNNKKLVYTVNGQSK